MKTKEQTHSHFAQNISASQVWKVWTDVNNWHTWDLDIEWAQIEDPFENGNSFILKPKSGPKVKITLQDIEPQKSFTDLARFPFARMYSIHRMIAKEDGFELIHTVRMEGLLSALWWHLVGKNVAAGMEAQTQKLIDRARQIHD